MRAPSSYDIAGGARQRLPARAIAAGQRSPRGARRLRYIKRIERSVDAPGRWALFVAQIAQLVDDDELDHCLGAVVEAPADRVQLFAEASGVRR
jgi:hypothetical protein